MCFNKLLVSGESGFSAHGARDVLLRFDGEECSTVYEQPGFVISCVSRLFSSSPKVLLSISRNLILSRLSGPHEIMN